MTRPLPSSSDLIWSKADLRDNPHLAPDKANRVRRMFAAIAGSYDLNNRVHSLGLDRSWRSRAVRLCDVQPFDHVLDVACGTGDLSEAFVRAGAASVTGLDFTEEMLEIARVKSRRVEARGGGRAPVYVQGDAMNLPFENASFDIVSIAFGIRNVEDAARALREFRRVLRPRGGAGSGCGGGSGGGGRDAGGGRLVVLEFSHPPNRVLRWLNQIYCERIMPVTATLLARDRSGAYRYLPQSVATFYSPDAFANLLTDCGFGRVEFHPMTFGVCTAYVAHLDAQ